MAELTTLASSTKTVVDSLYVDASAVVSAEVEFIRLFVSASHILNVIHDSMYYIVLGWLDSVRAADSPSCSVTLNSAGRVSCKARFNILTQDFIY